MNPSSASPHSAHHRPQWTPDDLQSWEVLSRKPTIGNRSTDVLLPPITHSEANPVNSDYVQLNSPVAKNIELGGRSALHVGQCLELSLKLLQLPVGQQQLSFTLSGLGPISVLLAVSSTNVFRYSLAAQEKDTHEWLNKQKIRVQQSLQSAMGHAVEIDVLPNHDAMNAHSENLKVNGR